MKFRKVYRLEKIKFKELRKGDMFISVEKKPQIIKDVLSKEAQHLIAFKATENPKLEQPSGEWGIKCYGLKFEPV